MFRDAVGAAEGADDRALRLRALLSLLQELDELGRSSEATAMVPIVEAVAAQPDLALHDRVSVETVLGDARASAGDYTAAERHLRAALAALDREYAGLPAPDTAGTLRNLATVVHMEGRLDEARTIAERSLAMYERTLGPDHPDVALPLTELATLALARDDLDAAQSELERVRAVRERALGPDHPYVAEPLESLGRIAERRGHKDEALALYRRAIAISERGFGPGHPLTAVAEYLAANVLFERGELAEARRLAEASVAIWDATKLPLAEAFDAEFLLARLVWPTDQARARELAERGRAGYAALAPPYTEFAAQMATWLEQHR
jgi:tetratricopeptide (TPR) repeat protein